MTSRCSWARSATGFWPRRAARSTSAHRSAARASSRVSPGSVPRRSHQAARTASAYAGVRSNRSRLPRSVNGWPECANSQSSSPVTSQRGRVDQQVLGVDVGVHEAGTRPTPSSRTCAPVGHLAQTLQQRRLPAEGGRVLVDEAGQAVRDAEVADGAGRRRRTSPARSVGIPARSARRSPSRAPSRPQPCVVEGRQQQVTPLPRQERRDQQPGPVRRADATAYLEDVGDRHQPAHQPAAPPRRSPGPPRRAARAGRSAPRCARPPTSATNVSPDQPPASGLEVGEVHGPHAVTRSVPRSGSRRGGPPAAARAGRAPRGRARTESRRANGPDWDRYADEYQATHGGFLGDTGFVWGPEGLTEDEAGVLGDVAGTRRARGRLRGRAVLPLGAACTAVGRRAGPLHAPAPALAAPRRGDRASPCRRCWAPRPRCRSRTAASTSCSARSARCSSSPTSTSPSPRWPGCCGRAAGSRSRSPTRRGGASPTTRRRPGSPRRRRTGTARRTSRWTTRAAGVAYVEHHRTLGDWVGTAGGARLPDRAPAGAGVARGPRPGLGWLVAHPRTHHSRDGDLRRRPGDLRQRAERDARIRCVP